LYELREALEAHAIVLAAGKIGDEGLAQMKSWNDEMRSIERRRRAPDRQVDDEADLAAWNRADMQFHMALLTAAGNARLVRAVGDLRVLTQVFRAQHVLRPVEDLERACDQHQVLIAALSKRDATGARSALCEHIRFACANALDSLAPKPVD
jgi:GntR family transcriptional repressor for pyruvate dehydrogenase complex